MKKTYKNVSSKRFSLMQAMAKEMVNDFCKKSGYQIKTWDVSDSDHATWHVNLKRLLRPTLEIILKVSRSENDQLTIEARKIPLLISEDSAIKKVDEIYGKSQE